MNQGRMVFSQIMDFFPLRRFKFCVDRYRGDHRVRKFACLDQFYCMTFAQLTGRESLRDIETCLRAVGPKLYHAGMKARVSRNTLAKANETRDWKIYRDIALIMIEQARKMYAHQSLALNLKRAVYALDSTVVDLCLTLFPWAQHRRFKSAVKVHTQLDLRANIPTFIRLTGGQTHDIHFLDHVIFEAGAFYIMDKGYVDFQRLHWIHQQQAFFVIRVKNNLAFSRVTSRPVNKNRGLRSDQTIRLTGPKSSVYYPDPLRRIHYVDTELDKRFFFLTSNFNLAPGTIARLYKFRWQIELFFKWIKQHLRIKAFYGTTPNAVKIQVWIAVSVYVLVAILKKDLGLDASMYEILQVLSVTLFEKTPIKSLFAGDSRNFLQDDFHNQLLLFDF
ncbi:MAG: IS4 family transposase [Chloroflexi bacterium]|nr:MAG: IS4 family transposase [Chloroflexota bacterium]